MRPENVALLRRTVAELRREFREWRRLEAERCRAEALALLHWRDWKRRAA